MSADYAAKRQVLPLIYAAVDRVNELRAEGEKIEKKPETPLMGNLDSLAMVNFVAALEEEVEEKLEKSISLIDGFDAPEEESPFRRIETLADFVDSLLE